MIIKMNGLPLASTLNHVPSLEKVNFDQEIIIAKWGSKKLKKLAIILWSLSGTLLSKAAHAGFYEQMKPLMEVFQEMALGFGSLAIIAGLILFAVKKRWGTLTLQVTAIVVLGVFLAPSALMLIAIVGSYLNDALYQAFKEVWHSTPVMGGK